MRWPLFWLFSICLGISIKADTERSKRDLDTLLGIKKSIFSTIFGRDCTSPTSGKGESESFKLYEIPGHENILVKAVPIVKSPEQVVEVKPVVETNPSIEFLESYLGTKTPEETLIALERVKTLFETGVLSDPLLSSQKLLVSHPPSIQYGIPGKPEYSNILSLTSPLPPSPIYPPTFQAPFELFSDAFSIYENPRLSYVSQEGPYRFSLPSELAPFPILPPGILVPELISRIKLAKSKPEFKTVTVGAAPNSYQYHQIHNDGSVTSTFTTDVKQPIPVPVRPIVVERIEEISEKTSSQPKPVYNLPGFYLPKVPGPVKVQKIPNDARLGGFSYHQVQDDGSVVTYANGAIKNPTSLAYNYKENPVPIRPIIVGRIQEISETMSSQQKPINNNIPGVLLPEVPGPVQVQNIQKGTNPGGYGYHQVQDDGSVTTYTDGVNPLARPGILLPPKLSRLIKRPDGKGGYFYERLNDDGSITSFSDPEGRNPLPLEVPRLVQVQNIEKGTKPGGYSYHQIQDDGSVTTYTDGGKEIPLSYIDKVNPLVRPVILLPPKLSRLIKRPDGKGGYIYIQINDDGSITSFSDPEGKKPLPLSDANVKPAPVMHNILLNRIGQIAEKMTTSPPAVTESPKLSTLLHQREKEKGFNSNSANSGYLYKQINQDGSVTTYTGNAESSNVVKALHSYVAPPIPDLPRQSSYSIFLEGQNRYSPSSRLAPTASLSEFPKVWLPESRPVEVHAISKSAGSNGYTSQQISNDRSVDNFHYPGYTHSVPVASIVPGPPAATYGVLYPRPASILETKPFGPDLPEVSVPVFGHHVLPSNRYATSDFIYKQISNDGATTTYTGSGQSERPDKVSVTIQSPAQHAGTATSPHLPPATVSFSTPALTSYEYKQIVSNNPNITVIKNKEEPRPEKTTEEPVPSFDKRVITPTKIGINRQHSSSNDKVSVVINEKNTAIHTASGSYKYVQQNNVPSENSVNEENEVTKKLRNSTVASEGTFANNPIVVEPYEQVNVANRGDIPD